MRLDQRVFAVVLAFSVLPLTAGAALWTQQAEEGLEQGIEKSLDATVASQARGIDAFLERSDERLRSVGSRTQLRLSLQEHLEDPAEVHVERMRRTLEDAKEPISGLRRIEVFAPNGTIVASTDRATEGQGHADRPWFQAALTSRSVDRLELQDGELVFLLAGPLILDGDVIGVLRVHADAAPLVAITMDHTGLGDSGETILARRLPDGSGLFLTPARFDADAALQRHVPAEQDGAPTIQALNGRTGVLGAAIDYRGEPVLAAARFLTGPEWAVVVKMDRSEALAPVADLRYTAIGMSVAVLVIVVPVGVVLSRAVARPANQLVATHERLREREARLSAIFDNAASGISVVDRQGLLVDANPRYLELVQRGKDDLLGMPLHELNHPDDREENERLLHELYDGTRRSFVMDKQLLRPDGTGVPVRVSVTALPGPDGGPVGSLALVEDLRERQALERARDEKARELERMNRQLEQFAYIASHDLQAPLRHVASYTQFLEEDLGDRLGPEDRETMQRIQDGVHRMQARIQALLQYSRAQRTRLQGGEVDLGKVMDDVVEDLGTVIRETGAEVLWHDLPTVTGDPDLLTQVFQNLVENSIKYRGDRPPRVEVRAERRRSSWRIRVQDNGRGFEQSSSEQIFGMFQRLGQPEEGTGIGLALCRIIIERHGGQIEAQGEPGVGATFIITLPFGGSS